MQPSILQKAGLTQTQIEVYLWLLEHGKTKASDIAKNIKRPRGVAYKALEELLWMDLIEKIEKEGQVALFNAQHPASLEKLFEDNVKKTKRVQQEFASSLPDLVSQFNLSSQKPGVMFYEGLEGIKKVINDNLDCKSTVYTYADMEEVHKYIKEINDEYAAKRDRLKLQKKVLLVDSEYTKEILEAYQKSNIEVKFVKKASHFATIMQIYDNKVSYVTLRPEKMIGIIIHDANVYEMHKTLFESMWENAE